MGINRKLLHTAPAEVGRIKVGCKGAKPQKSKGGREWYPPEKFENENGPYFVITKMVRGKGGAENFVVDHDLMKKLERYCDKDGKLRQMPIRVSSDIIDEVAPTRFNKYNGSNLFCYGSGKGKDDATRIIDGRKTKVDCPCDFLEARGDARCKPNMLFRMTLLVGDETRLGVRHAFRTTGWNSIKGTIGGLEDTLDQLGTLSGVKLWLCVKWEHKKDRDGTLRRIIVVYVECRIKNLEELVEIQKHAIERRRLHLAVVQAGNPVRLGLPAPGDESKAEQAEVAAEWYPRSEVDAHEPYDAEDDDEVIYDAETGEVIDAEPAPRGKSGEYEAVGETQDKPSQRKTDTALPAVGADDVPFEDVSPSTTKPEPEGSELRLRVARALDGVVRLRGKDARDQKWRKLVFAEACRAALAGREVGWKLASASDLEAVEDLLVGLLERAPLPLDEKPSEPEQQSLVGDEP
jgi:hypothetical protein